MNRLALLFVALTVGLACNRGQTDTFMATGIVEGTAVKVAAQTGGLLLSVNVEEGQVVSVGQVVAVVDTEKLVYQKEMLEAALAEVETQRQISRNSVALARSDLEHVEKKYRRFQELYEKQSASQQTLDDLKRAYDAAKTQLQNARQGLQMLASKARSLEAQLKAVQRQIADATVRAPLGGTVTTKYYEPGETVPPGMPVVEIIDLSKMWTKVYVSEVLLPRIQLGQPATVRIDGTERTLPGVVSWISAKAEFTPKNILTEESRTSLVYAVKVSVNNPDGILKHGMPVEVELALNR